MKKIILLALIMTMGAFSANAQTKSKIGVVNIAKLLEIMPEYDSVMVAYQNKYEMMQRDLQQLYTEFQSKQESFEANQANLTEMMQSIKLQELEDLQKRIQIFQEGAQDELNKFIEVKQAPIIEKIRKAVNEVAKENGFTHIINNSQETVLYYDESFDVLPLVKTKLNIKDNELPKAN